jgi:flagellar biosynthesis anti-sigma factor FlgM
MKIKNNLYGPIRSFENDRVENAPKSGAKSKTTATASDQVTLSAKALDLAKTIQAARENDGVRVEKVAELKQLIESGEYQPDAQKIARRILAEELDFWL